jgi:hypothetical protein
LITPNAGQDYQSSERDRAIAAARGLFVREKWAKLRPKYAFLRCFTAENGIFGGIFLPFRRFFGAVFAYYYFFFFF